MNDAEKSQYAFDFIQITQLKAKYGDLVDRAEVSGVEYSTRLAELFADDFELDLREIGGSPDIITEHTELISFFGETLYGEVGWGWHTMTNPIIDIDGDVATGQWLLQSMATLADNPQESPPPIFVYGRYHDEYVRTADGWKFSKVRFASETRTGEAAS